MKKHKTHCKLDKCFCEETFEMINDISIELQIGN